MRPENESNNLKRLFNDFHELLFQHSDIRSMISWINDWMSLTNGTLTLNRTYTTVEIIRGYNRVLMLYNKSHQLYQEVRRSDTDLSIATHDHDGVWLEEQKYTRLPQYLSEKEILNPLQTLSLLETKEALHSYQDILHQWLEFSLNPAPDELCPIKFEVYLQTIKLAEAAWLIVRRVLNVAPPLSRFEDTCPLLLADDYQKDPYLELSDFFACGSPQQYQYELKKWFRYALSENDQIDQTDHLLELHDQLIKVIQAGFIITQTTLTNKKEPSSDSRSLKKETYQDSQYILTEYELTHQSTALKALLTTDQIKDIRYGLREWLNCSISKQESIKNLEDQHAFGLYEKLEKIIWLLFILDYSHAETNKA